MPDTLNIGLIGCGRIMDAHLNAFQKLQQVGVNHFRITALCARRVEDALRYRKRGEGPPPRPPIRGLQNDPLVAPHLYVSDLHDDVEVEIYTDYREMIAHAKIDAVDIYSSLFTHHDMACAALAAGKHVMVEKPMAVSVKAARRMCEAAAEAGKVLSVAECARYAFDTRATGWVLRQGLIGELQMLLQGGVGGLWSPDRVVADTPWRHRKVQGGGGGSIDIGVHLFNVLRYLGGEITEVTAVARTFEPVRYVEDAEGRRVEKVEVDVDDTFMALLGFANGAIGQVNFSWAGHGPPTGLACGRAFYGSQGCLQGDRILRDDGFQGRVREVFEQQAPAEVKERFFPLGLTDHFALQKLDWLRAIETGGTPETNGQEGLEDLATSFAMLESSVLKRTVTVREVISGEVCEYQREIDEYWGL
jgi:predicted dehydrogenase